MMDQLTRGITPRKVAFTLALAFTLGIFPILGSTTILCFFIGLILQLNQPLLQAVNYLLYPLHLLLIPVFIRSGEYIFRAEPIPFNLMVWMQTFKDDPIAFLRNFGMAGVHAVAAWCIVAPMICLISYRVFLTIARRLPMRYNSEEPQNPV